MWVAATRVHSFVMGNKKGLASFRQMLKVKENPPPIADVAEFILPSFAGYAATRFVSRAVYAKVMERYPQFAKHASVASTFGAATVAWFAAHRIEKIARYHTPIVCGSGLAVIQSIVQAYFPKYGWIVRDHDAPSLPAPKNEAPSLPKTAPVTALPPPLFQNAVDAVSSVGDEQKRNEPVEDEFNLDDYLAETPDGSLTSNMMSDHNLDDLLN